MTQVKVRDLDEWVVSVLKEEAESAGHSFEQHLREMLRSAALSTQLQFASEQAKHLRAMEKQYGILPDSTEAIREARENDG